MPNIPANNTVSDIDNRIRLLEKINVETLDLEDSIAYYVALTEVLKEKRKFVLNLAQYRTAVLIESQLQAIKKVLQSLIQLSVNNITNTTSVDQFLTEQELKPNKFRNWQGQAFAKDITDIEAQIRTILFGVSFTLDFTGSIFSILIKTDSFFDTTTEIETLKNYCKENNFKLNKTPSGYSIVIPELEQRFQVKS
jgi:hypothetical protein